MNVIKFNEINSTNTYLKENYQSLPNLTMVVANHQTNGKGRLGRTWIDNDDLLFSILIKEGLNEPTDYSLIIASVIIKALNEYNPTIKWPNDIMIGDRKVCGILLEAVTKETIDCIIIGVGINVNTTNFPNDLLVKATSLKNEKETFINKDELLQKIINIFEKEYHDYLNDCSDFLENVRNHFYLANKKVSFVYNNKDINGVVKGINNKGSIVIELYNGELINLSSGEVSLNNVYKNK